MKEMRDKDITDLITFIDLKTNALANMLINKGLFSEDEYVQELYRQINEKIKDEETQEILRSIISEDKY